MTQTAKGRRKPRQFTRASGLYRMPVVGERHVYVSRWIETYWTQRDGERLADFKIRAEKLETEAAKKAALDEEDK